MKKDARERVVLVTNQHNKAALEYLTKAKQTNEKKSE